MIKAGNITHVGRYMFLLSHCRVKMTTKFGLVLVSFITSLMYVSLKGKQSYFMFALFLSQFVKYGEMSKNILKHKMNLRTNKRRDVVIFSENMIE